MTKHILLLFFLMPFFVYGMEERNTPGTNSLPSPIAFSQDGRALTPEELLTNQMLAAAHANAPTAFFMQLILQGGPFSDLNRELLLQSMSPIENFGSGNEDIHYDPCIFLWFLLRCDVSKKSKHRLVCSLRRMFVAPTGEKTCFDERLGILLKTLIFGDASVREERLMHLKESFANGLLSELEKREIQESFIYAVSHGKISMALTLLLEFPGILTQEILLEALQAATLKNEPEIFAAIIESGLLTGENLRSALVDSLMLSGALLHTPIFNSVLHFERANIGNLVIEPVTNHIGTLLNSGFSEDINTQYGQLITVLEHHVHERSIQASAELLQSFLAQQEPGIPLAGELILVQLFQNAIGKGV